MSEPGGFDRLRPRAQAAAPPPPSLRATHKPGDREGKSVLFSAGDPAAGSPMLGPLGTVTVRCSACRVTTSMTPWGALRAALPSLHLPLLRREYPSWMRCPSCSRRTWVRVGLR